ncbi:MAG: iron-sulfur cluster-binding domain-containing protein, partial [Chitinophagaceae bacterium]
EKRRSYSLTCSPELGERLCITVKKIDNGEFSRWLVYHAREGDVLLTTGISGYFILRAEAESFTYFFLAAGSGITPCYSLIHLLLETTSTRIVLLYSNKSVAQTLFYEQLQQWANEFRDRFSIHYFFSDSTKIENKRLTSFLLTDLLNDHAALKINPYIYLCGPYEYRLMATITLRAFGIEKERIRKEEFDPLHKLVTNRPPDTRSHNVTIRIGGNEYALNVQYPRSIVAVAKENKITVPYSCESGQCGSCAATCVSGKIWMANNEVLTDDEIARGRVLTCVGFPIEGDAVIDYGNL